MTVFKTVVSPHRGHYVQSPVVLPRRVTGRHHRLIGSGIGIVDQGVCSIRLLCSLDSGMNAWRCCQIAHNGAALVPKLSAIQGVDKHPLAAQELTMNAVLKPASEMVQ